MRIGLVSGEYPPLQGGVGDFTRMLGRALAELGHEVAVLTHVGAGPAVPDSITVEPSIARWGLGTAAAVARWAAARRLDVVNLEYQAAAYGLGLPIHLTTAQWRVSRQPFASVVTYHDLRVPYLFPKAGPLRQKAMLALGRYADAVIVTNPEDEAEWAAAVPGCSPYRVPIGSNVIPRLPAAYERREWRARHGLGSEDWAIGYFGFLNASKGGDTLLSALERLVAEGCPAHLLLIGGEHGASDPSNRDYAAALRARIAARGLEARVHRTGFVEAEEVSAALVAADVLALPYRDGASLRRGSLMAALAHGCAIVTTAVGLVSGPLADAAAFVPPDDAPALAAAVVALARDPARRRSLGERAAACAAAFRWEAIAAQTLEVYSMALARRRGDHAR